MYGRIAVTTAATKRTCDGLGFVIALNHDIEMLAQHLHGVVVMAAAARCIAENDQPIAAVSPRVLDASP